LREVAEHGEGDAEADGVCQLLGGFRGGDAHEACKQQRPASGADQRRDGEKHREEGRPDAEVGGVANVDGAGRDATGGEGEEGRERGLLLLPASGVALLVGRLLGAAAAAA
jgi:hypothetical protein